MREAMVSRAILGGLGEKGEDPSRDPPFNENKSIKRTHKKARSVGVTSRLKRTVTQFTKSQRPPPRDMHDEVWNPPRTIFAKKRRESCASNVLKKNETARAGSSAVSGRTLQREKEGMTTKLTANRGAERVQGGTAVGDISAQSNSLLKVLRKVGDTSHGGRGDYLRLGGKERECRGRIPNT